MSQTTKLIQELRAAGLTQSEISRQTGIPQPRISRWGAGEAPDTLDDVLSLLALHKRMCKQAKRKAVA